VEIRSQHYPSHPETGIKSVQTEPAPPPLREHYEHHAVFHRFARWSGLVEAGVEVDFLGTRCQTKYFAMLPSRQRAREEATEYPAFDEEYFEWIDLLESVMGAKERFTMMELGAGWGRWTARGAAAARQRGIGCSLVAVEAEPTHFAWMVENLRDNGVRLEDCSLLRAAVTGADGSVGFHVGDAASSYGQCIGGPVAVASKSLATLLENHDLVDLIDMDVQGAELEILAAGVAPLQKKVRRVHVETHSRRLHREIQELFTRLGWHRHFLFEGNTGDQTPWGRVNFQAGVQSWLNPALHTKRELRKAGTFGNSLGFKTIQTGRRIMDSLAPIGTQRRALVRFALSGAAGKFQRDAEDGSRRPMDW
jgi:FkbM family methyltransferase